MTRFDVAIIGAGATGAAWTGVLTGTIDYQSSQPWPFPRSLMLGFRAEAPKPSG
mgnify:CR=1 FL=1